jgi:homoserine dehydrogenase
MKVGILGFGNVAAATIEAFTTNQDLIRSKTATSIEFVRVATRTPSSAQGRVPGGCVVSDDCWAVVDDPQIDVVLELMGDVKLGRELVLRALSNSKHVITANKALLAQHGEEIMQMADQAGRSVLFEGAVAVSIPIIKTLRESAAANRISSIIGILNGTSNYVLSQMSEHGVDFATAVADAQRKGYAEADPTLDVNGEDAAHKLTLLASLAFDVPIKLSAVEFKGIAEIDQVDIEFAKRLAHQVKLIAQARLESGGMAISVQPTLVPDRSMLAQVGDSMNGIALQGDLLGSAFLYGSGAGGRQTASAVLADLLELANRGGPNGAGGAHNMGFRPRGTGQTEVRYCTDRVGAFYIRLRLDDKAGALAKVSTVLADADVSINSLLQDQGLDGLSDLIVITHDISSGQLRDMLPDLQRAAGPGHTVVIYPVLGDCGC